MMCFLVLNTSGDFGNKNGPTLSGRTVEIPMEDSFSALLARAAHREKNCSSHSSRHLGYSSGQVAGSFLRITPDVNSMIAKILRNTSPKDSKVCHKNTSLLPPPSHPFRQHIKVQDPDQKTLKPVINQSLKDPTPRPFQ